MIHDTVLVDRLSARPHQPFSGEVFRATRINADPLAPSSSGGRWAPAPDGSAAFPVLYTSLERDGAIAEVATFLADMTPLPPELPVKVSRLGVTTSRTLRLVEADLKELGVDLTRYGERDYPVTQMIGATLAFLELDGLVAPSARWGCTNLMLFTDNHSLNERLEVLDEEWVGWRAWAVEHGVLRP